MLPVGMKYSFIDQLGPATEKRPSLIAASGYWNETWHIPELYE